MTLKRVDMTLQNSVLALHERNGYSWAVLGLPHGPTVTFDLFTLAEKNWDLNDKKKVLAGGRKVNTHVSKAPK